MAEAGALLAGPVPEAVPEGVGLAAGELLALPDAVPLAVADPVALGDGLDVGLAGAAPLPPPRVVPWPGLPWTMEDSGLPAACSTSVSGTAQPMNAAAVMATGQAQRHRCGGWAR